ncbi:5-hydroxytryptamine receptor 3A-like [Anomaloglossus baeobatrachus]
MPVSLMMATWLDRYPIKEQLLSGKARSVRNGKEPPQKHLSTCRCGNTCSYKNVLDNITNLPGSDVRPVRNWKDPTLVLIDLSLYTVINLDTSLQIMTTYLWFNMAWKNEFLSWEPDDFCGIEKMLIPNNNFWLPDLYIYEM